MIVASVSPRFIFFSFFSLHFLHLTFLAQTIIAAAAAVAALCRYIAHTHLCKVYYMSCGTDRYILFKVFVAIKYIFGFSFLYSSSSQAKKKKNAMMNAFGAAGAAGAVVVAI